MPDAGVRHVVVRDGDSVVGLVSIRDVLAVLLGSTDARRRRRLPMVGSGADLAETARRSGVGAELAIHGGDLRDRWTAAVGHDRRSWRYDCCI
jgi:CBS domain-containing protein